MSKNKDEFAKYPIIPAPIVTFQGGGVETGLIDLKILNHQDYVSLVKELKTVSDKLNNFQFELLDNLKVPTENISELTINLCVEKFRAALVSHLKP